jgi:hypothetical protein
MAGTSLREWRAAGVAPQYRKSSMLGLERSISPAHDQQGFPWLVLPSEAVQAMPRPNPAVHARFTSNNLNMLLFDIRHPSRDGKMNGLF